MKYGSALTLNIKITNLCRESIEFYLMFFPYCSISELPMFMKRLLNSSTYLHKFTLGLFVLQRYIISYEDRNSSLHKSSPHPQSLNLKMPKIMITILFMFRMQLAIKSLYCVPTQKYHFTMILNCW